MKQGKHVITIKHQQCYLEQPDDTKSKLLNHRTINEQNLYN